LEGNELVISRKTGRLALAAILIVSLMVVASPALAEAACPDACFAQPGLSGSSMAGMSSPTAVPGSNLSGSSMPGMSSGSSMAGMVPLLRPFLSTAQAVCGMLTAIRTAADGLLPSAPLSPLFLIVAVLALALLGALLFDWTPRRAAAAFARILSPPGSALGVRLTI